MTLRVVAWNYLLIAPHALLLGVFLLLLRDRAYRRFPAFFLYVIAEVLQFGVLYTILQWPSATGMDYAIAYTSGLAVSTALRFGVIHEIFAEMFRNYPALDRFGKPLIRWVAVGLLLGGLLLAVYTQSSNSTQLLFVVRVLDRTASILQCGLLLGLFAFSSYLGLSWRSRVFGVALGLGLFASVELIASAVRSETGFVYNTFLNYLTMGTYHICVLIWGFYLLAPERSSQYALKTLPEHDLDSWNQELQRLLRQ
jgi:hypothetical protein